MTSSHKISKTLNVARAACLSRIPSGGPPHLTADNLAGLGPPGSLLDCLEVRQDPRHSIYANVAAVTSG
jgi:hypothetical protein